MAHYFTTTDPVTGATKTRKSRDDYKYVYAVWFDLTTWSNEKKSVVSTGQRGVSFTTRLDLAQQRRNQCHDRQPAIAEVSHSTTKPKK